MARDYSRKSDDLAGGLPFLCQDKQVEPARVLTPPITRAMSGSQASFAGLLRGGEETPRGENGNAAGTAGSSMRNVAPPSGRL